MTGREKGRFAPSPSGRMHLGNLLCSLLAWLSARKAGGSVVLRIEDLDKARCPDAFARQLEQDLAWLGLTWDEGGMEQPGYCQSQRSQIYQEYFDRLVQQGLVYPCFCSRAQLHGASAPHRSDGTPIYGGTCRQLTAQERQQRSSGRNAAMRLKVPDRQIAFVDGHLGRVEQNLAGECGDFILRRADGVFAYQLAVVVDDALMGVTQVVRGADLLDSTPRQLYLYELLGLTPPRFYHLPLLLAPDGRRLSKRDGDVSLEQLQQRYTPQEILGRLGWLAGLLQRPQPMELNQLLELFDWEKVPRQDILLPSDLF